MSIIQDLSAHRNSGWKGQYARIIRWIDRFKEIEYRERLNSDKSHIYFDTLYSCFQNIFMLKDWLLCNTSLKKQELNDFINNNIEIGICRDISNGTKHFDINHPSVSEHFGIINEFNPMSSFNKSSIKTIVIISAGYKYKPIDLIDSAMRLWDDFIYEKLS